MTTDTIAAVATASGRGGVGIIRVSGDLACEIAKQVSGLCPSPRYAHYGDFKNHQLQTIDQGITLYFKKPHSFTGEDVVEFQAHGGPVVLDLLMQEILRLGARPAHAGEFSERAYLNDKLDLAQAEAIADLIAADSEQAAQAAVRSLKGDFSNRIHQLVESLIQLRIHVESALDFPEEEIDFLADEKISKQLHALLEEITDIKTGARQGCLLKEGMTVVIAGKPNAGKSSLLNQLAGQESAIVTDIPGTTRDVLREHIQIDGLPLHVIDTAGLRDSDDIVEQEGIRRAHDAIQSADQLLIVIDINDQEYMDLAMLPENINRTFIYNKIDQQQRCAEIMQDTQGNTAIYLSARTGEGMDLLKQHLKDCMGYRQNTQGQFIARRRHLDAIETAEQMIISARDNLLVNQAGELVAEELRQAQDALSTITGEFSSDDLLGRIFSDFCIGK